jgi:hypothetical protein
MQRGRPTTRGADRADRHLLFHGFFALMVDLFGWGLCKPASAAHADRWAHCGVESLTDVRFDWKRM